MRRQSSAPSRWRCRTPGDPGAGHLIFWTGLIEFYLVHSSWTGSERPADNVTTGVCAVGQIEDKTV